MTPFSGGSLCPRRNCLLVCFLLIPSEALMKTGMWKSRHLVRIAERQTRKHPLTSSSLPHGPRFPPLQSRLFSTLSPAQKLSTSFDNEDDTYTTKLSASAMPSPITEVNGHSSLLSNLQSRPKAGGTWDVEHPLRWTEKFGRRSPQYEEHVRIIAKVRPGDDGYYGEVSDIKVPKVTIVRNEKDAKIVLERLNQADPSIFHACDTEVMDIDLSSVGPVGNGYVTCVSVYSGPDFDYGLGEGPGSCLWIDNLDDAYGVLQLFKDWFQNPLHQKVWHNYGFDRHVMWNEGINVLGFGGDTMHMARLENTARSKMDNGNGYSLEALTAELIGRRKKPMKELFGVPRLRKDGSEGSLVDLPPVEVMQRNPKSRTRWIEYSCYDAQGTWLIRQELRRRLEKMEWFQQGGTVHNLYEYYMEHMRPFGEVLTDMERRGIRVDARDYLATVEIQAREDKERHSRIFREWAAQLIGPDGLALNPASSLQLCIFLFGGAKNQKSGMPTEHTRVLKVPIDEIPADAVEVLRQRAESASGASEEIPSNELDYLNDMKAAQLNALCEEQGLKKSGNKAELQARLREHFLAAAKNPVPVDEIPADAMEAIRQRAVSASGASEEIPSNELDYLNDMKAAQLKALCEEQGLKISGKKAELQARLREHFLAAAKNPAAHGSGEGFASMTVEDLRDALTARGCPVHGNREELLLRYQKDLEYVAELQSTTGDEGMDGQVALSQVMAEAAKGGGVIAEHLNEMKRKSEEPPKYFDVTISSLGLEPEKYTAGGAPSVTADVIRKLAGDPFADPPKYGSAYKRFGKEGCEALFSLGVIGSIDTMIANFLTSLQELADADSRVHCSLNLNTETGRLSSRRPNLQNQPALEKDKYKIRKAFESSPGNNLIVADYGQLELRLLASMTNCQSMIDAFAAGGDFHSRTAIDMFPYVKQAVDNGECLLEWDYSKGDPPKPLLKDMFASERRKAKTLNFSIAYGKTAHGLSQDWGVKREEAELMLKAWYDARPEVEQWQRERKAIARSDGITRTLMGRYRQLPEALARNRRMLGHAERASINTPIQGGAADIAMMAMIKINDSEKLQRLGWVLLLQVHDELLLEGPEETAKEAFEEVLNCMEEPWVFGLDPTAVPLLVDGSYTHKTWYDAK